jgi:hypothetical protein
MLYDDRERRSRRRRQAAYERRQREGTAIYPAELNAAEIGVLIGLGCLREGDERDREQVGKAIRAMIRSVGERMECHALRHAYF